MFYFAFYCHDMVLSKHVLIDDRDFENYLTSEACVCLLVIV